MASDQKREGGDIYCVRSVEEALLLIEHGGPALRTDALDFLSRWARKGLASPHRRCRDCSACELKPRGAYCYEVEGLMPEHCAEFCMCFEPKAPE